MKPMSEVIALGYVGISAPDLAEWKRFACDGLGLQAASLSTADRLLLRMDERAWRISIEQGPVALNYTGWEIADADRLAQLRERLIANDVDVIDEPDCARQRGVEGLISCQDPGGNRLEFFWGASVTGEPFVSPTGTTFVTADESAGDMGLGHTVMSYDDAEAANHFYMNILGFRLSDVIVYGGEVWRFAHVNPRHHSFAFGRSPGPSALNHWMFETTDMDAVGYAFDRMVESGVEITSGLGKHTNDHMFSFYVRTPSGFEIEYGYDGRKIDDRVWIPSSYDSASFWGHKKPAPMTASADERGGATCV